MVRKGGKYLLECRGYVVSNFFGMGVLREIVGSDMLDVLVVFYILCWLVWVGCVVEVTN